MSSNKPTNKSFQPLLIQRKQETLELVETILSSDSNSLSLGSVENSLTVDQTLKCPTIRSTFKGELGTLCFAIVKMIVTRFLESFGFSNKPTDLQIDTITIDTIEEFKYDSIQDVILFYSLCRRGKFGVAKKGLDSNIIFGEWLPKYLEMKAQAREEAIEKEKSERKRDIYSIEKVKHTYNEIEKKNQRKIAYKKREQVKAYIDRITQNMTRKQLEAEIEMWSKCNERKEFLDLLKRKRRKIK